MIFTQKFAQIATTALVLMVTTVGSVSQAKQEPKTLTYRVRVPVQTLSCAEEARGLGERFASATKLKVVRSECVSTVSLPEDTTKKLHVLMVTYLADRSAEPFSAIFGSTSSRLSDKPEPYQGAYPTYTACLADLPIQVKAFESATRLIAVASFCELGKSVTSSYILQIDGFGKPQKRLFHFRSFDNSVAPETTDQVRALLTDKGATIVQEVENSFFYYAAKSTGVRHNFLANFREISRCQEQLRDAVGIVQGAGSATVIAACVPSQYGPSFNIETVSDEHHWFMSDSGYRVPIYYSLDECLHDKARILSSAKEQNPRVLGGLCQADSINPGYYRMNIYSIY